MARLAIFLLKLTPQKSICRWLGKRLFFGKFYYLREPVGQMSTSLSKKPATPSTKQCFVLTSKWFRCSRTEMMFVFVVTQQFRGQINVCLWHLTTWSQLFIKRKCILRISMCISRESRSPKIKKIELDAKSRTSASHHIAEVSLVWHLVLYRRFVDSRAQIRVTSQPAWPLSSIFCPCHA